MFFDEGWWYKDDVEKQEKLLKVVSKLWNSYWQSYEQRVSRAWVLLYVFSLMISDQTSFNYSDYYLIIHCLSSSMKRFFMASFSSLSFRMKLLTTSSKACSAFTLICALPARIIDLKVWLWLKVFLRLQKYKTFTYQTTNPAKNYDESNIPWKIWSCYFTNL